MGKVGNCAKCSFAFGATGTVPFNPNEVPDYAFLQQEPISSQPSTQENPEEPQPGPSVINSFRRTTSDIEVESDNVTPGKALDIVSPIPLVNTAAKKARRHITGVITSSEYIRNRKELDLKKSKSKKIPCGKTTTKKYAKGLTKERQRAPSTSSEEEVKLSDSSVEEGIVSDYENECIGCKEDYRVTKRKDKWFKCILCNRWLHDGCTSFVNMCEGCGRSLAKKK